MGLLEAAGVNVAMLLGYRCSYHSSTTVRWQARICWAYTGGLRPRSPAVPDLRYVFADIEIIYFNAASASAAMKGTPVNPSSESGGTTSRPTGNFPGTGLHNQQALGSLPQNSKGAVKAPLQPNCNSTAGLHR